MYYMAIGHGGSQKEFQYIDSSSPWLMLAEEDDRNNSNLCDFYSLTECKFQLTLPKATRSTLFQDFVAFGGVCTSWGLVMAAFKKNFDVLLQVPCLILTEYDSNNSKLRDFYSLTESKFQVTLRESSGKRCFSSQGWLLTISKDEEVNLLHPLLRVQIELPNLSTFSYIGNMEPVARKEGSDGGENYGSFGFQVLELNVRNGKWVKVESLGNRALFLGCNSSFSVEASDITGCKANCIYFTDDWLSLDEALSLILRVHVVYMGELSGGEGDLSMASTHHSMLTNVLGSPSSAKDRLIYSYGKSFNGFAAKLTDEEVARFSEMEGVASVIPNHILKLHTTRSWDFMDSLGNGNVNPVPADSQEGDVVVALLDTGIWPESDSFNDEGLGSPPAKWKGVCQGANFTCNNKLIGARYYNSEGSNDPTDFLSPRDSLGHGTHTASTAAGRRVPKASYFGLAEGVARGGVPGARIAVYKVCWAYGCALADILAAFDDAIADGVDVISVSLGSDWPIQYFEDPIAIGSFHAMKKGILTSNSAGNSGPYPVSVSNFAPWTLTVAASTIDRKFVAQVIIGNGQVFTGLAVNSFDLNGTSYPLIWGGDAVNYTVGSNAEISSYCIPGSMNSDDVQGTIVLCDTLWDGSGILIANGVGTIMADSTITDFAFNFPLPATVISTEDGLKIMDYIRSTDNPIATILVSETLNDTMAPIVVSFSSRGPNPFNPDILKPDLTAPGVDILAAWSPVSPPSIYYDDTRSVKYNVISGTSMSCPHASGAAAYVKAVHPNWSPAAIKSALMTTAYIMDPRKQEDLEFAYGSGHLNPTAAVDPGLVFDASVADYIDFLCKQGYNTSDLRLVTGDDSVCKSTEPGRGWDLNYPSFSLYVEDGQQIYGVFPRTVTNVGAANSTYQVSIDLPTNISVTVEPTLLSFSAVGETQTFTVKVSGPKISQQPIMSGAILWKDGVHVVRTPLVVYNYIPGSPYNLQTYSTFEKKPTFEGSSVYHKNGIIKHN
ncbi:hypothetical protein F0562_013317 [Nyssa sinensis]|uniref:Uncharacterized protein n=1 Tax=Nyssa sinensis TaxID=561372 RepID=A0A5J4ZY14_9ASTE|nr:hypothetical protein F0562_013317 [Nyssa sinensis]